MEAAERRIAAAHKELVANKPGNPVHDYAYIVRDSVVPRLEVRL